MTRNNTTTRMTLLATMVASALAAPAAMAGNGNLETRPMAAPVAPADSGARPRLVCSTTPVALMTLRMPEF